MNTNPCAPNPPPGAPHPPPATLRILDANANRAAEGMRTMEEAARFVLNATSLTAELKRLRHDLASATSRLPRIALLRSRDTAADVGTTVTTPTESRRAGVSDVVTAASSRTQQSLRCLEEYGKSIDADFATQIERIRYRGYDVFSRLEQICLGGNDRLTRLSRARLYALIDAGESDDDLKRRIATLAAAGVDIIQLRDRTRDDRTLFRRAVAGTGAARDAGVLWIINDRADIASASAADGVHVGQEELPVDQVRKIVGAQSIIGLSTHSVDQVRDAAASTADYIGCGPVFPGQTKRFDSFPGCGFLEQVTEEIDRLEPQGRTLPAFAIGGITAGNVTQVVAAGFGRIAVTGALAGGDAAETAAALRKALQGISWDE